MSKLTARKLAEYWAPMPSNRPDRLRPPGAMRREVWWLRAGLFDEVVRWSIAQGPGEQVQMVPMLLGFERGAPQQVADYVGGDFDYLLTGASSDGQLIAQVSRYDPAVPATESEGFAFEGDQVAHMLCSMAYSVRAFALQSVIERPRVDLDVCEPTKTARGDPDIPLVIVVRWRRVATRGNSDNEAGTFPVEWSHRWVSRAHLRHYPDGRIVPVRASIKGPKDKPLILKTRANDLAR